MSLLAGARVKNADAGYATDFVDVAMAAVLPDIVARGIRVVANAGGVNPRACAAALERLAASRGLALKIAVVLGDDVMPLLPALREQGVGHLSTGAPLPSRLVSANAYLGAFAIASALDAGAQVVITGRCVDSAVTLGALIHAFGWMPDDLDLLAAGSLAGHLIECGCQATGGLFTDWERVPDWAGIGYPIVECDAGGGITVTKPPGTGGLVSVATVGEQLLYEIGDPAAYVLPDVTCDFTRVRMVDAGADRVHVAGALGRAPPDAYKVSATYAAGYRCDATLLVTGFDAAAKAQRSAEALLARVRGLFAAQGTADFDDTLIDVIGAERSYGAHATTSPPRQAVMRVAATHAQKAPLELLAREVSAAGTSWAPGTTGLVAGRPKVSPSIRQFPFLVDKSRVAARVEMSGEAWDVSSPQSKAGSASTSMPTTAAIGDPAAAPVASSGSRITVQLIELAWGRSGDKGDTANIGILARRPEFVPVLREQLSEAAVASWLDHLVEGEVTRYELPGLGAFNFVCTAALGGGGMASLRTDPLGKGMAQILLAMPVEVDPTLVGSA